MHPVIRDRIHKALRISVTVCDRSRGDLYVVFKSKGVFDTALRSLADGGLCEREQPGAFDAASGTYWLKIAHDRRQAYNDMVQAATQTPPNAEPLPDAGIVPEFEGNSKMTEQIRKMVQVDRMSLAFGFDSLTPEVKENIAEVLDAFEDLYKSIRQKQGVHLF